MTDDVISLNSGRRLAIELGTSLSYEIKGVPTRLRTNLVGMEPDRYLIVKAPNTKLITGLGSKLKAGAIVNMRYVHNACVFAFQSKLLGAINEPVPLLIVEMPDSIEEHQIRSSQRVDCYLNAMIEIDDLPIKGTIIDISRTGCQCAATASELGDLDKLPDYQSARVLLRFNLPDVEGEQHLTGNIRNFKKDASQIQFGVKFDELVPKVYNRLIDYLLSHDDM